MNNHVFLASLTKEDLSYLTASPYELLILEKDEQGPALQVRVLALAYREGTDDPVGFALTEPPQHFIRDKVVRRVIDLVPTSGSPPSHGFNKKYGCLEAWQKQENGPKHSFYILPANDRDCDGRATDAQEPDCDDDDDQVYPGAEEKCDGKDNNCDGQYAETIDERCFGQEGELCFEGSKICNDKEGPWDLSCQISDAVKPLAYCLTYEKCARGQLEKCLEELTRMLTCELEVPYGDGLCTHSKLELPTPPGATDCRWQLVDDGGFVVTLHAPGESANLGQWLNPAKP